ncbi:MAG: hypothetical protein EOO63_04830 [Hymenobacter sp.]|nr:MAG: hypothetical protein EOO63_04830 [Hymenobacter sp.]
MSLVLLDTDTLTYFLKGNPTVVARAVQHIRLYGQLTISLITQYEVLHGLLYRDARVQLASAGTVTESPPHLAAYQ